jgi:carboxyl-terminal processing protease
MRTLLTLCVLCPLLTIAQTPDSKATDAYLITRMVEKFHVQPRPLDQAMSAAVYDRVLQALDDERIFLTQPDIASICLTIVEPPPVASIPRVTEPRHKPRLRG